MPFVNVKIAAPAVAPSMIRRLQEGFTELMAGVLRKKRELTAVLVEPVAAAGWAVGAEPVATAAHVEATVTLGTNTGEEKARFLAAAAALLKEVLGAEAVPVATYVVVREVPAESWGYDGRTQEDRRRDAAPL